MSKLEWLKWVLFEHPGPLKARAKQLWLFFTYQMYSLCCRLMGYPVPDFLEPRSLPAGRYILVRKRLPISIRLLDRIFPFGKWAHVEYVPYTPEAAEELRNAGKRVELIDISYKVRLETW